MSIVNALIARTLALTSREVLRAMAGNSKRFAHGPALQTTFHIDTAERRMHRALLDAAAVSGAVVTLGFVKTGGDLRYMVCRPCLNADPTCRYYTVHDLDLSEAAERVVYRRVNLDTIAALQIEVRPTH